MINQRKPNGYWKNKEHCREAASLYHMRWHFAKDCVAAYQTARKNGWLDEICKHMDKQFKYDFDEARAIAEKYEFIHDFREDYHNLYHAIQKHGLLNDICSHMKKRGSKEKRLVYVFEFEDNYAYVGLAYDLHIRELAHLTDERTGVNKHIKETRASYKLKDLTGLISKEEAAKEERRFIKQYKENGWLILNRSNGGELGTSKEIHSDEYIKEIASKCDTPKEFLTKHHSLYVLAYRRGIWPEIKKNMESGHKPRIWTNEKILEFLKPGITKHYCNRHLSGIYSVLEKRGILDIIFPPNKNKKDRRSPVYDGSKEYLFK